MNSSAPERSSGPPRRTEGLRVQGRSARVVEAVLETVAEEIGRVGYAGLRIEDVATRSGVNKTTIYRRWPNKSELVAAALDRLKQEESVFDTGSLRGDLLALMREFVTRVESPIGRGIVRMVQAERAHPEVSGLIRAIRQRSLLARRALFERAVQRGEIPAGSDVELLAEIALAPLVSRVVHLGQPADERFIAVLAEMIVQGAEAGAAAVARG